MSGRGIRIVARAAFCACGLVTLFNALPYAILRGVDLPRQNEWMFFVGVLGPLGLTSLAAGVLPRSWIAGVLQIDREDARLFSTPLKALVWFAAVGYVIAACAHSIPNRWNVDPQFMLLICPMYFVKMTFDPKPAEIFLLLAPLNAGVYGALGIVLGWIRGRRGHNPGVA